MLEHLLAAAGGGLKGAAEGMQFGDEQDLKREQLSSKEETAKLVNEIKLMIADMNARKDIVKHETPSGNAVLNAGLRRDLHETPSGDTKLRTETDLRKWLTPSANNTQDNDTRRRGQDFNLDLGVRRDNTTRRGQDLNVDLGWGRIDTTRRGQDLNFDIAGAREAGLNYRDATPSTGSTADPKRDIRLPAAPPAWPTPRGAAAASGIDQQLAAKNAELRKAYEKGDRAAVDRLAAEVRALLAKMSGR